MLKTPPRLVFGAIVLIGTTILTAALAWRWMSPGEPSVGCADPVVLATPPPIAVPEAQDQAHEDPSAPKILFIETRAAGPLARTLVDQGFDVTQRATLTSTAAELAPYDLVLVSDVPAHLITEHQAAALDDYVTHGGALLMAGGIDSFGSGGYQATHLERLLPVRFDSGCRDMVDFAVVFVVDTSASMSGNRLEAARESARVLAETLSPSDYVAVVGFDRTAHIDVRPQRAANRPRLSAAVAGLVADDADDADLHAGLREAHDILANIDAKLKHVIVVSDGASPSDGISDLVREMRASGITTSTVGLGDADREQLATIRTLGGGRFYRVEDLGSLPKIVMKETAEAVRRADDSDLVHVRAATRSDTTFAATDLPHAPPLHGYVTTRPKPAAERLLVSDLGETIFARWCHGAGTAAAWTSDADHDWSTEWLHWDGYAAFWSQVVRTSLRSARCAAVASPR